MILKSKKTSGTGKDEKTLLKKPLPKSRESDLQKSAVKTKSIKNKPFGPLKNSKNFQKKSSKKKTLKSKLTNGHIRLGVPGLDELFEKGIPKGVSMLIAGGPGSGKTILCLQALANAAANGEKCLYISFEESEKNLLKHMGDLGFDGNKLVKKGNLKIIRRDPFAIAGSVEALLAKARGELLIGIEEVLEIIPPGFEPDRIVFDSITAITSILPSKEEGYRVFIEQLFRYLESVDATSFLISETEQVPIRYSESGVEEFLADGIVALYNYRKQNIRVSALEVVKMRGTKIEKRIMPFEIEDGKGIMVYPEAMIFEEF